MTLNNLALYIEHTKLVYAADESPDDAIQLLCTQAKEYHFRAVCVRPDRVKQAKQFLEGTTTLIVTVIGFPAEKTTLQAQQEHATIGDMDLHNKVLEAQQAIADGADELDIVLNIAQFKQEASTGCFTQTQHELDTLRALTDKVIKLILETDLLTPNEIEVATRLCIETKMDVVKTSTGMVVGGSGATVENIERIKRILVEANQYPEMGIKASGNVSNRNTALAMLTAGATLIGTSQGPTVCSNSACSVYGGKSQVRG